MSDRAEVDILATELAQQARDETVGIALWVAAIDAVPIEDRIEWVERLTARVNAILCRPYHHDAHRRGGDANE